MTEQEIRARAVELLEDTLYYESRIIPSDYRLALIQFLEVIANG